MWSVDLEALIKHHLTPAEESAWRLGSLPLAAVCSSLRQDGSVYVAIAVKHASGLWRVSIPIGYHDRNDVIAFVNHVPNMISRGFNWKPEDLTVGKLLQV